MRKQSNTNRLPVYILGGLVVIAVIARIMTPPQPPVPGPRGALPQWSASLAYGKMGAWAVNPSGTMFAGAWSMKDKQGKEQSAIWIIDFDKQEARHCAVKGESLVSELSWSDDKTILGVNSISPTTPQSVSVDAVTAKESPSQGGPGARWANIFADSKTGQMGFNYPDPKTGQPIQGSAPGQIPGIVEGDWCSPAGVLALCRNEDNFTELVYDAKTKKLNQIGKDGYATDVKSNWPDAPKEMLFVTYRGGFKVDLQTGKTTQIFKYDKLKYSDDFWRKEVQNGRLYPRKDGGYTSVSVAEGKIDIRILDKDGVITANLLPRG